MPLSESETTGAAVPQRFVLVHSPFYGLGGRLAVLASAVGYATRKGYSEIRYSWGPGFEEFLCSPQSLVVDDSTRLRLMQNLPASLHAEFSTDANTQRDTRHASEWPAGASGMSGRDIVYISRDDFQQELDRNESRVECMRRLFRAIVPGAGPKSQLAVLESQHRLERELYAKALGVHVRHGNGEKYYHEIKKIWGVKPPSADRICSAIRSSLALNEIESLVVASDCRATVDLIQSAFGSHYRVIDITEPTQPLGSGCSHNESYFGPGPRNLTADTVGNDERAMAEILCLSKCRALCGGFSHFFEAAIGFSTVGEHSITRINNQDRYTTIAAGFEILAEIDPTSPQGVLKAILLDRNILLDGLFSQTHLASDLFAVDYFDEKLFRGSLEEFRRAVEENALQLRLMELRLY